MNKPKLRQNNQALIAAVLMDDTTAAKYALNNGADVNARDEQKGEHNETALILAVQFAGIEMVNLLLEKGAEIDAKDNYNKTALFFAPVPSEIFDILLSNGADLTLRDSEGKNKLISLIPLAPSLEAVKELIKRGIDVNARDDSGETALSLAKSLGLFAIIKFLELGEISA